MSFLAEISLNNTFHQAKPLVIKQFALIYELFSRNSAQRYFSSSEAARYQAICPHLRAFSAKFRSTILFIKQSRSLSSNSLSSPSVFREIPLNDKLFIKQSRSLRAIRPHLRAFSVKYRSTINFSSSKAARSEQFALISEHFQRNSAHR